MVDPAVDRKRPFGTDAANIVYRLHEEVINGDRLDLFDELIDAGYVNHGPFPWGVRDRDDLRRFYMVRELGFPDVRISTDEIIAKDDIVAYRMTVSGTDTGEFLGLEPTGKPVRVSAFGWARVRDGRIAEQWGLIDDLGILEQIGVDLETIGRHADRRRARSRGLA